MGKASTQQAPVGLRGSASAYLGILVVGSVLGLWAGYLWPNQIALKGQAPAVLVPLVAFLLSLACWVALRSRARATGWALSFLFALGLTWLVMLIAFKAHGDAFTYVAFALPPILVMLALKPPTRSEGIAVLLTLAWTLSTVLLVTLALEVLGVLTEKFQPAGIINFDEDYYWLPLNSLLGIEGRWPGPFGHNGYTAMMGAFVIVVAVSYWRRANWLLLLVGLLSLVVTSGRASAGAAVVGIVIVLMFSKTGPASRIPRRYRVAGGLVLVAAGFIVLFAGPSGLTGRQKVWPAFIELWKTSPWTGVGTEGIASGGEIASTYGHAHNMYFDVLTRYGLFALVALLAVLALAAFITFRAALGGFPGPLALLVAYLVTALTEPRNDWLHPGTLVLMIVVSVLAAAAYLRSAVVDASQADPVLAPQ